MSLLDVESSCLAPSLALGGTQKLRTIALFRPEVEGLQSVFLELRLEDATDAQERPGRAVRDFANLT